MLMENHLPSLTDLLCRKRTFSPKHVELEIGDINAELITLKSKVNGNGISGTLEYFEALKNEHTALGDNLTLLAKEVDQKKLACIAAKNNKTVCEEYRYTIFSCQMHFVVYNLTCFPFSNFV